MRKLRKVDHTSMIWVVIFFGLCLCIMYALMDDKDGVFSDTYDTEKIIDEPAEKIQPDELDPA